MKGYLVKISCDFEEFWRYHYYNGVSERMAAMMPSAFTPAEGAMSEEYLGMAGFCEILVSY